VVSQVTAVRASIVADSKKEKSDNQRGNKLAIWGRCDYHDLYNRAGKKAFPKSKLRHHPNFSSELHVFRLIAAAQN
jgi:hypothetical protein